MYSSSTPSLTTSHRPNIMGIVWVLLFVISAVPIYWFALTSLGSIWLTPEYSHGPLIPVISLYLFLRELRDLPAQEVTPNGVDSLPGLVLLILAMIVGILGNLARIPDVVSYALILWVGAFVLIGFGWNRGKRHWAPVLHLIFMLALPQILYWRLSTFLQLISSEIGVWFIRLMNVPVFLSGNIIDLGVYKLHVAEACSGLRYLFPILSFSYLFGILYKGPFWHKALLFMTAAPITVLMNSVRIGIIGVLVNSYGISQAEGFLHYFEGWVIFGACIVILFGIAAFLQSTVRNARPLNDIIDVDTKDLSLHIKRVLYIKPTSSHLVALLVSLFFTGIFVAFPLPNPPKIDRETFSTFPMSLDGWQGRSSLLDPTVDAVLAADDYINAVYLSDDSNNYVQFFSAWYRKQTEGQAIHSPEACLPGDGWEVASIEPIEVDMPGTVYKKFKLNRAVIQKGKQKQLVYYWFEQRGKRMTNDFAVKALGVYDAIATRRGDGAIVRFITNIKEDEGEAAADQRIQGFMKEILPRMPNYIPN